MHFLDLDDSNTSHVQTDHEGDADLGDVSNGHHDTETIHDSIYDSAAGDIYNPTYYAYNTSCEHSDNLDNDVHIDHSNDSIHYTNGDDPNNLAQHPQNEAAHSKKDVSFKGFRSCSRCSCLEFTGSGHCCDNCGHNYDDHN